MSTASSSVVVRISGDSDYLSKAMRCLRRFSCRSSLGLGRFVLLLFLLLLLFVLRFCRMVMLVFGGIYS